MKKNKVKLIEIVSILLLALVSVTCTIGLGDSVDAKPPTVAIAYPPVQSVIRNTFTMNGTASDDVKLLGVTARVVNTVTGAVYEGLRAEIDPVKKTWSLPVNVKDANGVYAFPDGTYQITISATDGANRTTVASTTYEIDNTPPVMVLNRPSTFGPLGTIAPEVYGSELKVTGSVNDDHPIERLEFQAYTEAGAPIGAPLTYSNISAVGMDIILAKFYNSPTTEEQIAAHNRYLSIWNQALGGTQNYYATVNVSDSAREFNPPADVASPSNERGNVSSAYYIYDDIYSSVFAASGFNLQMKDLTAIFNNTYADVAKATQVKSYLDTRKKPAAVWSTAAATFSLNPDNSPTWTLVGFDPISVSNPPSAISVSNDSKITLRVSAGRDGIPLDRLSFRVYLDPCTPAGVVEAGDADDIYLIDAPSSIGLDKISKSGQDYVIATNIGTLENDQCYLVKLVGRDESGMEITDANGPFGFYIVPSGAQPVITFDEPASPADLSYRNTSTMAWSGIVVTDSTLDELTATMIVYNHDADRVYTPAAAQTVTRSGFTGAATNKWSFTANAGVDGEKTGIYRAEITVFARTISGASSTTTRRVYIDRQSPTLTSVSWTPTNYLSTTMDGGVTGPAVNGLIGATVQCYDNVGIALVTYRINDGAVQVAPAPYNNSVLANLDTRAAVQTNGNYTLEFTITDTTGNVTVDSRTVWADQATDIPAITLNNLDQSKTAPVDAGSNLLSGNSISFNVTDDDGVLPSGISIVVRNSLDKDVDLPDPTISGIATARVVSQNLTGLPDGEYSLQITATDNALAISATMPRVYFSYDNKPPTLIAPAIPQYTRTLFDMTGGTATDLNALADLASDRVTITQSKDGSPIDLTGVILSDVTTKSVTWAIQDLPRAAGNTPAPLTAATNGLYEYTITAQDRAGRTVQTTRSIRFDVSAPSVTMATPQAPSADVPDYGNILGTTALISGTSDDSATGASGVKAVYYNFDGSATRITAGGTVAWSSTATLVAPEGPKTLYVWAEDNAGNISTAPSTRTFVYDTAIPVASITAIPLSQSALFSLDGLATDGYGVSSVSITQNGVALPGLTTGGTAQSRTFAVANLPRNPASPAESLLETGTYVYRVVATDATGKTSTPAEITIKVDITPPNVNEITAPLASPPESMSIGVNAISGTAYIFRGNASDADSPISRVWYVINGSATAPVVSSTPTAAGYTAFTTAGTWALTKNIPAELPEGLNRYLHVLAEDSAGNRSVSATTVRFDVDRADPVLSDILLDGVAFNTTSIENKLAQYTLSGLASDTHGIASVAITQNGAAIPPAAITLGGTAQATTWSLVNLPYGTTDNDTYEYVITATDLTGKTHSLTRRVRYDTVGPELTVMSPAPGSWLNALSVSVNGIASDSTAVSAVYYQATAHDEATAPTTPADPSVAANWTSAGWTGATGTNSWNLSVTEASQGRKKLWFSAVDTLGNVSATTTALNYGVDTETPNSAIVSAVPANTSALFSMNGTATDSNALADLASDRVTITQSKDGGTALIIPSASITIGGTLTNGTWSLANLPRDPGNMSNPVALSAASDGEYEYVLTVTDVAGKIRQRTAVTRFDLTSGTAIIASPSAPTGSVPDAPNTVGANFTFSGTASDAGSGVKTVYYNLVDDTGTWITAAGMTAWSASGAMSGTEGLRTLYVWVEDNAGNISSAYTRPFIYDTAPPVATITPMSTKVNAAFQIGGTALDNYGVDIASITVTQNGVAINTNGVVHVSGSDTNRTWTLQNLPRNPASVGDLLLADGNYSYIVTVTDKAGKQTILDPITITVDQTPPSVNTITSPGAGQTGTNALSGTSYVFRGSASDAGVGVAKIWYAIDTNAAAPAITTTPAAAGYTEVLTSGEWSFVKTLPDDIAEGLGWRLHVLAEDASGNRTDPGVAASVVFDVDRSDPVASETTYISAEIVNIKTSFSLEGEAIDSHGIFSLTVSQKQDDGAVVPINTNGPTLGGTVTNRTWTLANLPRNPADIGVATTVNGVYEYIITATDLAGKTHSVTRRLRFDTIGPELTVVSPADAYWSPAATIAFNGVASDLTAVDKVYYQRTAESVVVAPDIPAGPGVEANWTGAGVGGGWTLVTGKNTWNFSLTEAGEGRQKVWLAAVDTAANPSVPISRLYGVDLNSPTLNSSIPEQNTRVLFGLSGDAADTNALADISTIVITQSKDGAAAETVPGITVTLAGDEKSATWSVSGLPRIPGSMADSVPLTTASDGEYEYVITATDVSGKTRQRTASVRFDRTEPVMAISTAIPATWFPLAAFPISGTNSDGGSGIGAVEYSLDGTNFSALSFTTTNWSGTIPVSSGVNTIRLRISDRAGNQTVLPDQTLNVDLEAPSVVVTDPSEILRVRSGMDIPITFDAWDENPGSGLQSVSVTRVGSQNLGTPPSVPYTGEMTITGGTITLPWTTLDALAPALVDGTQYVVTVRATDRGARTGSSTFSFVYDATPPSVAIATPALSDPATLLSQTINQTVTVSGTASDTQMLRATNSVSLDIVDGSGTVLMNLDTFSGAAANTWSYNLDTTNATVLSHGTAVGLGTRIILRATAWDAAGNTNFVDRPVTINQESDRPVITLSNLITDPTDPDYPSILQMIQTVYGSVLDDDGITSVQANNGDGWTVVPLTGSGFTYTTTGTDGSKSLSFRIVDSAGRTFETGTATQPQFVNGTGFVDGPVPYSVDTVYPEIFATIRVDTQSPYDFAAGVSDLTTNKPFGGSTAVFALEVRASDANGIDTVSVTVPGAPGSPYAATASGEEAGFTIFRTGPIDVSAVPDGAVVVTALVTDNSGLEKSSSNTILVDNTVPTVTNDYPRMGTDKVNGLLDISGQALDAGSGLLSVEYNLGYDYALHSWAAADGTFSWKIPFAGTNTIEKAAGIISVELNPVGDLFTATAHGFVNGTPVWLGADTMPAGSTNGMTYYVRDAAADTFRLSAALGDISVDFSDAGEAINVSARAQCPAGDNLWLFPVLIRASDKAGNVYTTPEWTYLVTVDPSGDKPSAVVTYPNPSAPINVLGGIIRITGYAEDDDAVDSVYMQIDVNGDGLFTALDVAGATDWYSGGLGRAVTGGASWRQSINESQEFNPVEISAPQIQSGIVYRITELGTTDFALLGAPAGFVVGTEFTASANGNAGSGTGRAEPTKRTIYFRVRAQDIYGTYGGWSNPVRIDVDKNVPKFGYTNAFTLTQGTIERLYQPDMWVRGSWVLSGTIEDESGIDRIEISSIVTGSGSSIPVSLTENPRVSFTNGTTGDQGYELSIQIPTATLPAGNTLAVTITAFDNSTPQMSAQQTFSIKYDNIAPTINAYEGVTPVVNTNYLYEAKGSVVETGSGFERVFVYFQRTGTVSGVDRIYNPMLPVADSRVNTSGLNFVLDSDVPLFAIPTFTKTSTTLQSASLANNDNVRVGSVVYLDGLYCRITDYNSGTGTITWDEDVSQAVTNAAIVYALVLDNTTAEYPVWAPDYSSYTIMNDDGDGLIESVTSAGSLYTWKTSVDSRNIPDGNITVHYVAFDKAGNKAHGSQATSVRNNPPLLAKVTLATDLSGNNAIEADEWTDPYSAQDGEGKDQAVARVGSTAFKAKGRTHVEIDVVGGNNDLQYSLTVGAATIHPLVNQNLRVGSSGSISEIPILLGELEGLSGGDGVHDFVFTIWDATEEYSIGTSTYSAILTVPMTVDVIDEVSPRVVILPFHWTSASDNSLYNNSKANGHVELPEHLSAPTFTAGGANEFDLDPKLSGKISVRGTAYDDQRLTKLWMYMGNGTDDTDQFVFTDTTETQGSFDLNPTNAFSREAVPGTYSLMAEYIPGTGWVTAATLLDAPTDQGWKFTVDSTSADTYLDQSGHKVNWRLDIDTSKLPDVAEVNRYIRIIAEDKRALGATAQPNASSQSETLLPDTIETKNVPSVKVDVVPYITGISRSGDFNTFRSRQGRYALRQTETISILGYNLFNSPTDTVVIGLASQTIPGTATVDGFSIVIPTAARSGAVQVTINSVGSLNNLNDNDVAYNQESSASDSDTVLWKDDRRVHVWRSDDSQTGDNRGYFSGSTDPVYPAMTQNGGTLYASWSNYATSSVFTIGNNENYAFATHRIASSYDPLEQTDIAFGNRRGVIYNANTFANNNWNYAGAGGVVVWDAQANGADNVTTGNGYEVEYLYHDRRLMQFTAQRIAYQGNNIHVSYFDTETKALKYWYTASNNNVGYSPRWINIDGGYDAHDGARSEVYGTGATVRTITDIYVANGTTVTTGENIMRDSGGNVYVSPVDGVVDIAISVGSRISGTNAGATNVSILFSVRTSTNRVVDVSGSSRSAAAGEFSAIDTTPTNNFPVIAYYDITNRTVKIARASAINPNATQWTLQTVMNSDDPNLNFSGKYISMKIDSQGYVHLAFYRNSTGDLIYMKSTNNPTNGATAYTFGPSVLVDSTGSVGIWADITLVNDRPWISYLDSSYTYSFDGLKIAYYDPLLETEDGDTAGDPDTRDGWEYMNAAMGYEVQNERTSIEPDGGTNFWGVAIGYKASDFYRIAYYVD